jgi:hypothetical protein
VFSTHPPCVGFAQSSMLMQGPPASGVESGDGTHEPPSRERSQSPVQHSLSSEQAEPPGAQQ